MINKAKRSDISSIRAKLTDTSYKTYKQEEKLTYISYKWSDYENRLDKLRISGITKFETAMKEQEDILNTNIDKTIDDFKYEAYSSINNKLSPLN